MHSANAARSQRRIGKQTRDEKEQGIYGEKIVSQSIDVPQSNNDADQPDHGQADTDHRGRDGEKVNTEIFFEMRARFVLRHK